MSERWRLGRRRGRAQCSSRREQGIERRRFAGSSVEPATRAAARCGCGASTGRLACSQMASPSPSPGSFDAVEVLESQAFLLRDLDTTPRGLSAREADRRLLQYGPNALRRRGGVQWPRELARQLTHPLALLLWLAAGLSFLVGSQTVGIAVVLVIVLNAAFAFVQELQAERAVEALAGYMPQHATVLRDGAARVIEAVELVPGDVVVLEEGERVGADMRLLFGAVEVDLSTLTGESVPVLRSAELQDADVPRLVARDLVFSGTTCIGGEAEGGRVRDRHAYRAWSHRGADRACQGGAQPARAAGPSRRLVDRWDRGGDGDCVRSDRDLRGRAFGQEQRRVRGRVAGRQRARGAAAGDHARARGGRRACSRAGVLWSSA